MTATTASPVATPATAQTAAPTAEPPPPTLVRQPIVAELAAGIPAYDRNQWRHWGDDDGDCQNTRHEVLIERSRAPVTFKTESQCQVVAGYWIGLYTNMAVASASDLDVDHMVPLKNSHDSGGWAWDAAKKEAYANDLSDPDHLIAVTASANRSKGSKGPEEWKPPDADYWCEYATDWIRIKNAWALTVTLAEQREPCPAYAQHHVDHGVGHQEFALSPQRLGQQVTGQQEAVVGTLFRVPNVLPLRNHRLVDHRLLPLFQREEVLAVPVHACHPCDVPGAESLLVVVLLIWSRVPRGGV